jgi:hypothetical protein
LVCCWSQHQPSSKTQFFMFCRSIAPPQFDMICIHWWCSSWIASFSSVPSKPMLSSARRLSKQGRVWFLSIWSVAGCFFLVVKLSCPRSFLMDSFFFARLLVSCPSVGFVSPPISDFLLPSASISRFVSRLRARQIWPQFSAEEFPRRYCLLHVFSPMQRTHPQFCDIVSRPSFAVALISFCARIFSPHSNC